MAVAFDQRFRGKGRHLHLGPIYQPAPTADEPKTDGFEEILRIGLAFSGDANRFVVEQVAPPEDAAIDRKYPDLPLLLQLGKLRQLQVEQILAIGKRKSERGLRGHVAGV